MSTSQIGAGTGTLSQESLLTRKGQVTIPAAIRRELGLKRGDPVGFTVERGRVRLERRDNVVKRTAAVFSIPAHRASTLRLRAIAEQAIVDDVVERMGEA